MTEPTITTGQFDQRVASALPCAARGERILAAVSGGADSVALLLALRKLQAGNGFGLHVAHLNHGLRGREANADADWVEQLCRKLEIAVTIETADLATGGNDGTLEETARKLRYEFLTRTARAEDCGFVATAHTADDQAETVLHHILRGTGLSGLRGMPAERNLGTESDDSNSIRLIRPLLQLRRADVEAYLRSLGQDFRHDASNTDQQFTRNRIRHTLLPLLREQFNPRVEEALLRLSHQSREAADALESVARELLDAAALEITPDVCRLDRIALQNAHPHLIRCALVQLWDRAGWPRQMMGFADWQRAAALVQEDGPLTLPGNIDARVRGNAIVFRRADE